MRARGRVMRRGLVTVAALLSGGLAQAAEVGCERLAWPLDTERALIAAATEAGDRSSPPLARRLVMRPLSEVALPKPPERAPRDAGAHAGLASVTVPEAGLYRVTLDAEGWLDVIQDGTYRRAEAFTGVRDCPGIRKSVRFRLDAGPVTIQVTGPGGAIGLAVTREP